MSAGPDLFDLSVPAGRLMAATDWSATPIGAPETWSQTLQVLTRSVQASRYPMLLLWGEDYTQIYNDAYSELIGDRHPAAMGNDCRITLSEGWPVLEPLIEEAKSTGVASWVPALQLLLIRAGYREEAYFSVSHAPVTDDDGETRGVLTICSEVTDQVVGERRLRLLQQLSLGDDTRLALEDVAHRLVTAVADDPSDVPFLGLYLRDGAAVRRIATSDPALPGSVAPGEPDPWDLLRAAAGHAGTVAVPETLARGGAWQDPVTEALVVPIPSSDPRAPLGVLVAGVSPSRALDDLYRSFFELLAQQVGVALRNALAYEEERQRAEALAELDRAKTEFFTNVSHEFRTPLTLMLGPLQDALAAGDPALPAEHQERVTTALDAARRLLKLVNNLLTFSSLEAGSELAAREPVDLAALTVDVASGFRSAVERAGLRLDVRCPPLPRPVVIDPEHWTTIVTNLLSNALKFTFTGAIEVRLTGDGEQVSLEVRDTGVGIPEAELPRLFDRFHRVRGTASRSHEGSGIGLALVKELAVLHGGDVDVTSEVGTGTRFLVRLPWPVTAAVALPRTPTTADALTAAVTEAESWISGAEVAAPATREVAADAPHVLVADDNADMRAHIVRLLEAEGWQVTAVADGDAALHAATTIGPDLLLTDVMMPGLDGFELLRAIRDDPRTQTLPVVMLSARAGEGASTEGLEIGADDYVVKPFVSSDLIARLRTTMTMAGLRSRHVAEIQELARATALVTSGRRIDDALRLLTDQVRGILDARGVTVTVDDPEGARSALVYTVGNTEPSGAGEELVRTPVLGRRNRVLGTVEVVLSVARARRPQTEPLLTATARVLAAVVEEGWHSERQVAVAATLQGFLLPDSLPEVDGVELAASYRPAEREVQVGGDWYDVLELPDGRVALSVGDVAGHGLESALLMGQLRTAVRAYALGGMSPAETTAALDELMDRLPGASMATFFLAYLDVATGNLTWCSAGHPPPAVVRPGAPAGWIEGPVAPPLGAMFGQRPTESEAALPPEARLVLYTDGLVERRETQLDVGMPELLALLEANAGADAEQMVSRIVGRSAGGSADDVAVVVLHRLPVADQGSAGVGDARLEIEVAAAPESAAQVRRAVRGLLDEAGVDDDVAFELLIGLSEAVNNAVEHAVDPTRDVVVVRAEVDSAARRVRLEVQDFGQWRERRSSMDRGHGATLMGLGGEVRVLPGDTGTLVTLEREL
ncbi:signal transduction histidine kinase/DNA-binding response OmpR family regulator [Nocardioides thalensis]|uniref:histidine kinase n=1 Tax=Nocardioides thalensis TaxID=1914755 RepID=A0A853C4Z6_9ACTN|nr:SpoIIE family protein phosphatase [Nocardioides thalensis]NYJ02534.1 signal transduction histidine kinase/DNA-binding response OmpR family regulator [Nocardioides thalensis]